MSSFMSTVSATILFSTFSFVFSVSGASVHLIFTAEIKKKFFLKEFTVCFRDCFLQMHFTF